MKTLQKGSSTIIAIVTIVVIIIGAAYFYNRGGSRGVTPVATSTNPTSSATATTPALTQPVKNGTSTSTVIPAKPGVSATPKNIPKAHNAFGFNLLKTIRLDEVANTTQSIFISPPSIALALSMVYNGARADTKTAIQSTLRMQGLDIATINQESLGLMNSLKNPDPKVELAISNSVWAKKGMTFKPEFSSTLGSYYNAKTTLLDFADVASPGIINSWVSQSTRGKIPTIIDSIPYDAVMYIVNAVYFKGGWTTAFDKELTEDRLFTLSDGTKNSVPFMSRTATIPYLENNDFQSVNLTYGANKRISMYVFLPKDAQRLDNFVDGLTPEKWNAWMTSYVGKKGTVILPKFKITYEKQLKSILTTLGMGVAFGDKADLTGIGNNLFISAVKHKSFVDVDEEGTTAAAVTGVEVSVTSAMVDDKTFLMEVNHPFFFAIRDNQSGEILFMGVVKKP